MGGQKERNMVDQDSGEVARHVAEARELLDMASQHLADGELRQACKKGWGAAESMAKAVALVQGWEYQRYTDFNRVMNQVWEATGNDHLRLLHGRAHILFESLDFRTRHLIPEVIGEDLADMGELLDILEPLTVRA